MHGKPGRGWGGQEPPSKAKGPQCYLGQEVLTAADRMVESLDQQRLHVLSEQPGSRVEPPALLLWLPGRLAVGGSSWLPRAVGVLGSLCHLLARARTGVSQADGFSFLLSAA